MSLVSLSLFVYHSPLVHCVAWRACYINFERTVFIITRLIRDKIIMSCLTLGSSDGCKLQIIIVGYKMTLWTTTAQAHTHTHSHPFHPMHGFHSLQPIRCTVASVAPQSPETFEWYFWFGVDTHNGSGNQLGIPTANGKSNVANVDEIGSVTPFN